VPEQHPPLLRQPHPLGRPDEKLRPELALQLPDGLGDGRLADAQEAPCGGEAALLRHRGEEAQGVEVDGHSQKLW
jgi:hypothetical protein